MLLKLLKYDFRAMWKSFSLIWGAALVLSVVNRFTLFQNLGREIITNSNLFALALGGVIIAMLVISIGFVINRFSRGLLGDEGYLMHTLPVRSWQLVLSKLICGVVTWIISGVVAFISPFLMSPIDWWEILDLRVWKLIVQGLSQNPDTLLLAAEFCLLVLSIIVLTIAIIYLSTSVGHLSPRHKRLVSIAAFIGLYVLLANFYTRVFTWTPIEGFIDTVQDNVYWSLFACSATMLLPAALFLAVVCWILEHKLNLE